VAARAAAGAGAIGFNFNPVGDRIRITSTNQNFRINPDTGAAGNTGTATTSADGTDAGGSIAYLAPASGASTPSIVATAYTNLVGASPRNATATFGTVQYGIDTANNNFVRFADSNAGTIQGSGVALSGLASGSVLSSNVGLTVVSQAGGAGNVIVATVPTSSGSNAYTINPTTGAATQVSGALSGNAYIGITFTTAVNNFGVMQPKNTVAGIAGVPSLLPYFNLGIIFKQGQEDYTQGNALLSLRTKLVQFFGNTDALGCSNLDRPSSSAPSQYTVHANMNITQELFDAFNGQVASAASSFGVSEADVATVGGFLATFGGSTIGTNSRSICTQPGCTCVTGYGGNNCQTFTGASSGSTGSASGSTGSAGGSGNTVTQFTITFSTDFATLDGNTAAQNTFRSELATEIAQALNIDVSRVAVTSLRAGSTVAVVEVTNAPAGAQTTLANTANSSNYRLLSQNTGVQNTSADNAAAGLTAPFLSLAALAVATMLAVMRA